MKNVLNQTPVSTSSIVLNTYIVVLGGFLIT